MAFGDRLRRAIGGTLQRLGRALAGTGGQQPQPPSPRPQVPAPRPTIIQPTPPQEVVLQPRDDGTWVPVAQPVGYPQPVPGEVISAPQDWEGYGEEVTLHDAAGYEMEVFPPPWDDWDGSFNDWYRLSTEFPASYLRDVYGFNNIDILYALEEEGYDIDWDVWKQDYEAAYG